MALNFYIGQNCEDFKNGNILILRKQQNSLKNSNKKIQRIRMLMNTDPGLWKGFLALADPPRCVLDMRPWNLWPCPTCLGFF